MLSSRLLSRSHTALQWTRFQSVCRCCCYKASTSSLSGCCCCNGLLPSTDDDNVKQPLSLFYRGAGLRSSFEACEQVLSYPSRVFDFSQEVSILLHSCRPVHTVVISNKDRSFRCSWARHQTNTWSVERLWFASDCHHQIVILLIALQCESEVRLELFEMRWGVIGLTLVYVTMSEGESDANTFKEKRALSNTERHTRVFSFESSFSAVAW